MVLLFGLITALCIHNDAHGWGYICLIILMLNARSAPG